MAKKRILTVWVPDANQFGASSGRMLITIGHLAPRDPAYCQLRR